MTNEQRRPYLTGRRCGRCLVPFKITERRDEGWLYVTYACPCCGYGHVVTFSPQELAEWAKRGIRQGAGAEF